jgi:hypothetical protein
MEIGRMKKIIISVCCTVFGLFALLVVIGAYTAPPAASYEQARKLGMSIDKYEELRKAFNASGISTEVFNSGIEHFQKPPSVTIIRGPAR